MCALLLLFTRAPVLAPQQLSPQRGELTQTAKGKESMYATRHPAANHKAEFSGNPLPGFIPSREHNYAFVILSYTEQGTCILPGALCLLQRKLVVLPLSC